MSRQSTFDKVGILGIDIDAASNADAITYICEHGAPGQPPIYVVKPYVEFLDRARRELRLRDLINNAELVVGDGVALNWAAAYLYAGPRTFARFWLTLFQIVLAPKQLLWPLTDRAAGITFTWPLLEAASQNGLRVFLIGDPVESTIAHTADTLKRKLPQLQIVGTHSGRDHSQPPGSVSADWLLALAETVSASRPDLILVGMGFPLQETVCEYLASHTSHGVYIGEGGTFDYEQFGGIRPRAPRWVSRIGLEWLWRLGQQPSRLRRQLAIPRFIWRVWAARK